MTVDVAKWLIQFGAFGLVAWLILHTFKHTIPRIVESFRESLQNQLEGFKESLLQQREDFKELITMIFNNQKEEIKTIREDLRLMGDKVERLKDAVEENGS